MRLVFDPSSSSSFASSSLARWDRGGRPLEIVLSPKEGDWNATEEMELTEEDGWKVCWC